MRRGDVRAALLVSWLIVSAAGGAILAAPFVMDPATVAALVPACESKIRYGRPCSLCGMTTAFFHIAEGDLGEAGRANRGGIALFSALGLNLAGAAIFLGRRSCNS